MEIGIAEDALLTTETTEMIEMATT